MEQQKHSFKLMQQLVLLSNSFYFNYSTVEGFLCIWSTYLHEGSCNYETLFSQRLAQWSPLRPSIFYTSDGMFLQLKTVRKLWEYTFFIICN